MLVRRMLVSLSLSTGRIFALLLPCRLLELALRSILYHGGVGWFAKMESFVMALREQFAIDWQDG